MPVKENGLLAAVNVAAAESTKLVGLVIEVIVPVTPLPTIVMPTSNPVVSIVSVVLVEVILPLRELTAA